MKRILALCTVRAGLLVLPCTSLAQAAKPPLPIEAIAGEHLVARTCGLALSPDGRLAAYAVQDGERMTAGLNGTVFKPNGTYAPAWNCDLRIADVQSGKSSSITEGKGSNWAPIWSPDGSRLAFYSDRGGIAQVWIWNARDGKLTRASDAAARAWDDPVRWMPDSRTVIARLLPMGVSPQQAFDRSAHHPPSPVKTQGVLVYDSDPQGGHPPQLANSQAWDFEYARADLAAIDFVTGGVRRLVTNRQIAEYRISPDGKQIAYSTFQGFDQENSQRIAYNLEICSTTFGDGHQVASNIHLLYPGKGFSWSPDGRQLAYVAEGKLVVVSSDNSVRHQYEAPSGETFHTQPYWDNVSNAVYFSSSQILWRVDLPEGRTVAVARLSSSLSGGMGTAEWFGKYKKTGPGDETYSLVASYDGGRVCSPDGGNQILLRSSNGLLEELMSVDTQTGSAKVLWQKAQAVWTDFVVSADSRRLVYEAEDVTHPNDLWTAAVDNGQPQQLTDLNPEMQKAALGSGRMLEWTALNGGEPVVGGLLLPGNYQAGTKYPLVICVYGEGKADDLIRFGGWLCGHGLPQLLASRGYAYLVTGGPIRVGTPMTDIVSSVLPAVDRLVAMGIVDPEHVGIIGHSDGGYEVASFLVAAPRLKAAVMVSGYGDLMGAYGFLDRSGANYNVAILEGEWSNDPMGVKPWDNPLRYVENSPAYFLDRVQTPLLIFHGADDTAVPAYASDQMFVGLRRLHKRVEYVKYEEEDHFGDYWSYDHKIDYYGRVLDWFNHYLGPTKR